MAEDREFNFTDYARIDGGTERHHHTDGKLTLGPKWTLHFKSLGRKTLSGGMGRFSLLAQPLSASSGGCRVTVTDNQDGKGFSAFTLPDVDAAEFNACIQGLLGELRSKLAVEEAAIVKRETEGTWWTAPGAFKGVGIAEKLVITGTAYLGGWSGHPRKHGDGNSVIVSAVGIVYSGFRQIFAIPWAEVDEVIVGGPEHAAQRITATRLVTMGVLAVAAQKKTKSAVLIITLRSGERAVFSTRSLTAAELRAKLTVITSLIRSAKRKQAAGRLGQTGPLADAPNSSDGPLSTRPLARRSAPALLSVADEIAKLQGLVERGVLTEQQFAAQRDKLLNL